MLECHAVDDFLYAFATYIISSGDIVPPYTGGEEFWYTGTLTAIGPGGADSTNIRILFQGVPR